MDADEDGCFDAIEGAGSLTTSDINNSGVLNGGENANGIPNVAAPNGQAKGTSQDANAVGSGCCTSVAPTLSGN